MKPRVLVLGAEHGVGRKLVEQLAAGDWAAPMVPARGATLEQSLNGIDAVFNGTKGSARAIGAAASTLVDALRRSQRPIRLVHLSSMTVYGSQTGTVAEDAESRPDLGAYGAAHIAAEAMVRDYPHSVILRPGCEYGPACPEWSGRIARLLIGRRLGDLGAGGDGVCNLLYIDDLLRAAVRSLQLPHLEGRCFNLAMRPAPTWNGYFMQFARALGAVPVARIGARRLRFESKLAAAPLKICELLAKRVGGSAGATPAPITASLLNSCSQEIRLDSRAAEHHLQLAWTPLADGLAHAAAAYRVA